ncbi:MAG: hypothetical protein IJ730_01825 [Alphaproteobacteria bacterium]|nr:hypothetical protein [Alphaproteobacteria bacterium]
MNKIQSLCYLRQYEKALNIFKNIFDIETGENKNTDQYISTVYEEVEAKELFIYVLKKYGCTNKKLFQKISDDIKKIQSYEGYYDDDILEDSESEEEKEPKPQWWE